jgi:hypothetical protein
LPDCTGFFELTLETSWRALLTATEDYLPGADSFEAVSYEPDYVGVLSARIRIQITGWYHRITGGVAVVRPQPIAAPLTAPGR